jgi:hypothetical protein
MNTGSSLTRTHSSATVEIGGDVNTTNTGLAGAGEVELLADQSRQNTKKRLLQLGTFSKRIAELEAAQVEMKRSSLVMNSGAGDCKKLERRVAAAEATGAKLTAMCGKLIASIQELEKRVGDITEGLGLPEDDD